MNGVPGAELIAPDRPGLDAVVAALEPEFEVRVGEAVSFERVLLDTFDGLLRGAGLTLRHERGRLELIEDGHELPDAVAILPELGRPMTADELPPGDLREAVADEVGVRALLPLARLSIARQALAMLDPAEKTVARLTIEGMELIPPRGRRVPLHTRLRLLPVRGYDDELRRSRELVEQALELTPPERSLFEEAVLAAGGTPGGVSAKIDVPLRRGERTDTAAVRVLRRLLEVMDANLPGTIADTDSEFLHDYRVSLRRSRSVQRELRHAFPPDELSRLRDEFKWLQRITSDARDLDVHVQDFESLRELLREETRSELEPLLGVLRHRRLAARREMVRHLRSERAEEIRADWESLLEDLVEGPLGDRPDAVRPIDAVTAGRIRKVYRKMVRMGGGIGPDSPPEDYHELRKKGKELRYLLELFGASLFASDMVKPMIKTLKGLQDVLGRHQDREVQMTVLRSVADEVAARPGGSAALMAMGVLIERLEDDAAAARVEFASAFDLFAASDQRKLVKRTFRS